MNTRHITWTAIAVGGGLLISTLGACSRGYHHGYHDIDRKVEWVKEEIDDELELNAGQKDELDRLADYLVELHQERKSRREALRQEALALAAAPTLDQGRLLEIVQEHTALVNEKAPETIARVAGFTDTLDAEQRGEITERMTRWIERHSDQ